MTEQKPGSARKVFFGSLAVSLLVVAGIVTGSYRADALIGSIALCVAVGLHLLSGGFYVALKPLERAQPAVRGWLSFVLPLCVPPLLGAMAISVTRGSDFLGPIVGFMLMLIIVGASIPVMIIMAVSRAIVSNKAMQSDAPLPAAGKPALMAVLKTCGSLAWSIGAYVVIGGLILCLSFGDLMQPPEKSHLVGLVSSIISLLEGQ